MHINCSSDAVRYSQSDNGKPMPILVFVFSMSISLIPFWQRIAAS